MRGALLDRVVERHASDRAPGVMLGGQAGQGIHIMLRVRPRSTWRRTTRCIDVAELIMKGSLTSRTPLLQMPISCRETYVHHLVRRFPLALSGDGTRLSAMTQSTPEQATGTLAKTASAAYDAALDVIAAVEPRVAEATRAELRDQRSSLKLIASENYASPAVLLTMGTWFSDKYAEGTVGHRFYAGCQNVDTVEALAAEHARELFGAPYAYVQPHSGIDANLVAFWSILAHRVESPALERHAAKNVSELSEEDWEALRKEFGNQRMLGMSLDAGGHLTHGFRPNISGKMFHQRSYGTDPETGLLDYDRVRAAAREFKPLVLIAGYSAYPRRVDFAKMREIADEVGATLMVDMAHFAGLVAGKVFTGDENPVPHAHITTTTTHKSLRGPRGGLVLATEEYAPSVDRGCPMVLGGPLSHVMAAKAVALAEARQPAFATYAQNIADNAKSLAEGFLSRDAKLVTGGTDNHIVLLDVTSFGLTGRQAESALLDAGVVTNRNSVPSDPNGAWYTSGIRFGTPALTTRGFGHDEFDKVAELVVDVLSNTTPSTTKAGAPSKATYTLADGVADRTRAASAEMLDKNPLYPGLELS
jgi:glycine hydroxymethyltransferase